MIKILIWVLLPIWIWPMTEAQRLPLSLDGLEMTCVYVDETPALCIVRPDL